MTEPWSFDSVTLDLINAYVRVVKIVNVWGVLANGTPSVYGGRLLPFVQEPFPACWIYQSSVSHNFAQGTKIRQDIYQITLRVITGPLTPSYRYNPELKAYELETAIVNELTFRRYLEDPTSNNDPFRYIMPDQKLTVLNGSQRPQVFEGSEQGSRFIGMEIPTSIGLEFLVGRKS